MSRLLLLFAIVALIYLVIKAFRKTTPPKPQSVEDMVCCAHCGIHIPVGESIRSDDQSFCCAAHRDGHRKQV